MVCRDKQHYQYITPTGEVVLTLRRGDGYQARPFTEGLAPVSKDDEWGFIDQTGKWVIEPAYDRAYGFKEGVCSVRFPYRNK